MEPNPAEAALLPVLDTWLNSLDDQCRPDLAAWTDETGFRLVDRAAIAETLGAAGTAPQFAAIVAHWVDQMFENAGFVKRPAASTGGAVGWSHPRLTCGPSGGTPFRTQRVEVLFHGKKSKKGKAAATQKWEPGVVTDFVAADPGTGKTWSVNVAFEDKETLWVQLPDAEYRVAGRAYADADAAAASAAAASAPGAAARGPSPPPSKKKKAEVVAAPAKFTHHVAKAVQYVSKGLLWREPAPEPKADAAALSSDDDGVTETESPTNSEDSGDGSEPATMFRRLCEQTSLACGDRSAAAPPSPSEYKDEDGGWDVEKLERALHQAGQRAQAAAYKAIFKGGGAGRRKKAGPRKPAVPLRLPTPEGKFAREFGRQRDFRLPKAIYDECERTRHVSASRKAIKRSVAEALAEFQPVKRNVYAYRKEVSWEAGEEPVCTCAAVDEPGGFGCLDNCINRDCLQECSPRTCPLKKRCGNQRMQRRQGGAFEVRPAGGKGLGVFAKQAFEEGDLIGEYVGEVLPEAVYLQRQKAYADERHKYFMNLPHGEVIDASRIGSACRFLNHSCSPNAETQIWTVNGEPRIGLFAACDVAKDEEIQFNYNYERYEKKHQPCFCGAPACKGIFGRVREEEQSDDDFGLLDDAAAAAPLAAYPASRKGGRLGDGTDTRPRAGLKRRRRTGDDVDSLAHDPVTLVPETRAFSQFDGENCEAAMLQLGKHKGRLEPKALDVVRAGRVFRAGSVADEWATGFVHMEGFKDDAAAAAFRAGRRKRVKRTVDEVLRGIGERQGAPFAAEAGEAESGSSTSAAAAAAAAAAGGSRDEYQ